MKYQVLFFVSFLITAQSHSFELSPIDFYVQKTSWPDLDSCGRVVEKRMKYLVMESKNKSVNTFDDCDGDHPVFGRTPLLFESVQYDAQINTTKELLKRGADANLKTSAGFSPLEYAIKCDALISAWELVVSGKADCRDIVPVMVNHIGSYTRNTALLQYQLALLHTMIGQHKANVNHQKRYDGSTPLIDLVTRYKIAEHDPAHFDHFRIPDLSRKLLVYLLLMHGADPEVPNLKKQSAIDVAYRNGFEDLGRDFEYAAHMENPKPYFKDRFEKLAQAIFNKKDEMSVFLSLKGSK